MNFDNRVWLKSDFREKISKQFSNQGLPNYIFEVSRWSSDRSKLFENVLTCSWTVRILEIVSLLGLCRLVIFKWLIHIVQGLIQTRTFVDTWLRYSLPKLEYCHFAILWCSSYHLAWLVPRKTIKCRIHTGTNLNRWYWYLGWMVLTLRLFRRIFPTSVSVFKFQNDNLPVRSADANNAGWIGDHPTSII